MLLVVRLVSVGQGKNLQVCQQRIGLLQLNVELCNISYSFPQNDLMSYSILCSNTEI
jgi:hypothetical protein